MIIQWLEYKTVHASCCIPPKILVQIQFIAVTIISHFLSNTFLYTPTQLSILIYSFNQPKGNIATPPRPLLLREARFNAQRRILRTNRRIGRNVIIRTPASGVLTREQVRLWLNPSIVSTLENCEVVIDVYIEQVCHSINRCRGLISPNGRSRGNAMRAMLSQPHTFYHQILPIGSERRG
jgi:hypothetical protein